MGIDKSPKEAQAFAIRVQEAMNDAHTAVYPFDVSQLEGGSHYRRHAAPQRRTHTGVRR